MIHSKSTLDSPLGDAVVAEETGMVPVGPKGVAAALLGGFSPTTVSLSDDLGPVGTPSDGPGCC
jgi:hypothetical protein